MQETKLTMKVVCPVCNEDLSIEINLSLLKSVSGLYYVPVVHHNHGFLLYIDENGMVRGYQIFETIVTSEKQNALEKILSSILREDSKSLSLALAGALLDLKMAIYSENILRILDFFDLNIEVSSEPIFEEAPEYLVRVSKVFYNFVEEVKSTQSIEMLLALKQTITKYKDMLAETEKILSENKNKKILFDKLSEQVNIKSKVDVLVITSFLERHNLLDRVIFSLI